MFFLLILWKYWKIQLNLHIEATEMHIHIRFVDFSFDNAQCTFILALIYVYFFFSIQCFFNGFIENYLRGSDHHFFPLGSGNIISSHKRMWKWPIVRWSLMYLVLHWKKNKKKYKFTQNTNWIFDIESSFLVFFFYFIYIGNIKLIFRYK